jgi:hypothetical protein
MPHRVFTYQHDRLRAAALHCQSIDIVDTTDDENARSKDGADLGLITLFAAPVKIRSESIEEGPIY